MGVVDDRLSSPAWRSEGLPRGGRASAGLRRMGWIFLDGEKKRGYSREARCVWQAREWNARS